MLYVVKEEKHSQLEMEMKNNINRAQIKLNSHLLKIMIKWNTSAKVDKRGRPEKEALQRGITQLLKVK